MLSTFSATLSPMLVMLLSVLTGFFLNKKNLVPKSTASVLSKLETYVFVPSLILKTFLQYCTVSSLKDNYRLIIYCLIALFLAFLIAYLISPFFSKDSYERNVYRYALVFSNFSFLGNSIVPSILGEDVLYLYMLYTLPLIVAAYSWGVFILIPAKEKKNVFSNLINPVFAAIIIGIVAALLGFNSIIPDFVRMTITNFSSCMGPVAMILTGFVIGDYDVISLFKNKKVFIVSMLKLIVLPLFFVFMLKLSGADKTTLTLTFFAFGTALGLNTVIFPSAYGGDAGTGASMAMIAQLLCVITIPVIYAVLKTVI